MIDHEDYQAIFPTVLFYARRAILREAIFVMDGHRPRRGGTKADGIACELARKDIPSALVSELHWERKPVHDYFP